MATLSRHFQMFQNVMWIKACHQMNSATITPRRKDTIDDPYRHCYIIMSNVTPQRTGKLCHVAPLAYLIGILWIITLWVTCDH